MLSEWTFLRFKMFKVQENGDGSTSIFCNTTGRLICTVRGNGKVDIGSRVPRPVNIVEPVPKPNATSCNSSIKLDSDLSSIEKEQINDFTFSEHFIEDESEYEISCIKQANFCRNLNLVPKEQVSPNSQDEFPLRFISRVPTPCEFQWDLKNYDDSDLCSPFGQRLLRANAWKNFVDEPTALLSIKKYDSYCRVPLSSMYLSGCNFPKLRCRETKNFPITYRPQKTRKLDASHMYCFTSAERRERIKTLETGLSKRSRCLKILCDSKQLALPIKKLTKEEIMKWTERKPGQPVRKFSYDKIIEPYQKESFSTSTNDLYECQSTMHTQSRPIRKCLLKNAHSRLSTMLREGSPCEQDDIEYLNEISSSVSQGSQTLVNTQRTTLNSSRLTNNRNLHLNIRRRLRDKYSCNVELINMLHMVHKIACKYYVKGTNIRVNNYVEFIDICRAKSANAARLKNVVSNQRLVHDHAYHRMQAKTPKSTNMPAAYFVESSKSKKKVVTIIPFNSRSESSGAVNLCVPFPVVPLKTQIPLVDLTNDEPTSTRMLPSTKINTPDATKNEAINYAFKCFGCGHQQNSINKIIVQRDVHEHMKSYHSVSQPGSFLSVSSNKEKTSIIIEAFPGYKQI